MTRISTRKNGIATREEFDAKVDEIAQLDCTLRTLEAELEARLQATRAQYDERLTSLRQYRDSLFSACDSYASKHPEDVLTPGLRRGESTLARFGFRLGNPRLVLLSRAHKWEGVIQAILQRGGDWPCRFITSPAPKPNKEAIKEALSEQELASIGLRVEQTDSFWVEAKDDASPTPPARTRPCCMTPYQNHHILRSAARQAERQLTQGTRRAPSGGHPTSPFWLLAALLTWFILVNALLILLSVLINNH